MILHEGVLVLFICSLSQVHSAKQQVQLSDSYLPVAMQVIAHLTDQMAFEVKDADITPRPTERTTTKAPTRPTRPTTSRPYVTNGWWTNLFSTKRPEMTTPFHKPGLYAPYTPPNSEKFNWNQNKYVLLPVQQSSQYTVLGPKETKTEEPLLSIHHETVKPIIEKRPELTPLLPPHYFVKVSSRSDGYVVDDFNEDNLQYLSDEVRDMIKMAHDPHDDKLVDVWEGVRQGGQPAATKAKVSASNLRLLLLYDLLSRDAKKQRLSDYHGFSPDVMKDLVESSNGGARAQLKMALSKMVERKDCTQEYANNRAREIVIELGKDESKMSMELRYLEPLLYQY